MNSNNIILPKELIPYFRSNHAGETGAVYIYKAIIKFSKNKDILRFSKLHLSTETKHLNLLERIIPKKDFSKLIGLWKFFGYLTGFIPSILGRNFIYTTIFYVETFVEKHYGEQVEYLEEKKENLALANVLRVCCEEEVAHKKDAANNYSETKENIFMLVWGSIVESFSNIAVSVAKKI